MADTVEQEVKKKLEDVTKRLLRREAELQFARSEEGKAITAQVKQAEVRLRLEERNLEIKDRVDILDAEIAEAQKEYADVREIEHDKLIKREKELQKLREQTQKREKEYRRDHFKELLESLNPFKALGKALGAFIPKPIKILGSWGAHLSKKWGGRLLRGMGRMVMRGGRAGIKGIASVIRGRSPAEAETATPEAVPETAAVPRKTTKLDPKAFLLTSKTQPLYGDETVPTDTAAAAGAGAFTGTNVTGAVGEMYGGEQDGFGLLHTDLVGIHNLLDARLPKGPDASVEREGDIESKVPGMGLLKKKKKGGKGLLGGLAGMMGMGDAMGAGFGGKIAGVMSKLGPAAVILAGVTSLATMAMDGIKGWKAAEEGKWKAGKVEGAIGAALGGMGSGAGNALKQGAKGAAVGAMIGMVGGPVGMIVGAVVGAAVGGIMGFIGGEKIATWLTETKKTIKDVVDLPSIMTDEQKATAQTEIEAAKVAATAIEESLKTLRAELESSDTDYKRRIELRKIISQKERDLATKRDIQATEARRIAESDLAERDKVLAEDRKTEFAYSQQLQQAQNALSVQKAKVFWAEMVHGEGSKEHQLATQEYNDRKLAVEDATQALADQTKLRTENEAARAALRTEIDKEHQTAMGNVRLFFKGETDWQRNMGEQWRSFTGSLGQMFKDYIYDPGSSGGPPGTGKPMRIFGIEMKWPSLPEITMPDLSGVLNLPEWMTEKDFFKFDWPDINIDDLTEGVKNMVRGLLPDPVDDPWLYKLVPDKIYDWLGVPTAVREAEAELAEAGQEIQKLEAKKAEHQRMMAEGDMRYGAANVLSRESAVKDLDEEILEATKKQETAATVLEQAQAGGTIPLAVALYSKTGEPQDLSSTATILGAGGGGGGGAVVVNNITNSTGGSTSAPTAVTNMNIMAGANDPHTSKQPNHMFGNY